jgi:glycosyltransferase involved in cell wall biosynthesis
MGAIHFSIDKRLAEILSQKLNISIFVETGTFNGDSVAEVATLFKEIHTCEIDSQLHTKASLRFKDNPLIKCHHGSSPSFLRDLSTQLRGKSAMYWLDAHWCSELTNINRDSQASSCPLLEELNSIGNINRDSVIWIDDARYFLTIPPRLHGASSWPKLREVFEILLKMGGETHDLTIINDTILLYPKIIEDVIDAYSREYGEDWLMTAHKAHVIMPKLKQSVEAHKLALEAERKMRLFTRIKKHLSYKYRKLIYKNTSKAFSYVHSLTASFLRHAQNSQGVKFLNQNDYWMRLGIFFQYEPKPLSVKPPPKTRTKNSELPTLAIVTPSFNQGHFLEKTIRSVIESDYPGLQYAVVDGYSTDNSPEIIQSYRSKLHYAVSEPDEGQSHAIVKGFMQVEGEIMAYLNSDDVYLPGALHFVGEYFNTHPEIDVIYGDRVIIDGNDYEVGRWILPKHCKETIRRVDWVPQETMFWRSALYRKVGGIDKNLRFAMDWDLILKFINASASFVRVPYFLAAFRAHESQKSQTEYATVGSEEVHFLRVRELGPDSDQWQLFKYNMQYERRAMYTSFLRDLKII